MKYTPRLEPLIISSYHGNMGKGPNFRSKGQGIDSEELHHLSEPANMLRAGAGAVAREPLGQGQKGLQNWAHLWLSFMDTYHRQVDVWGAS